MSEHPTAAPLLDRLARLRERVALLVERRSAVDPTAADPLRGLYLSEEAVGHLLRPAAEEAVEPETWTGTGTDGDRLLELAERLGLSTLDARILLLALAPDLDRSFEPLYGYLNDDVGRRRATVGLALDLCGLPAHSAVGRARFHPGAPLAALGLLALAETERPFLSRSLQVPDRVTAFLLGDDAPDAALAGHARLLPEQAVPAVPAVRAARAGAAADAGPDPLTAKLAKRLAAGPATVYLREQREGDGLACAAAALSAAGLAALHLSAGDGGPEPLPELLREARLRGCAIVVSPLPEQAGPLVRELAGSTVPVLLTGPHPYDPQWCDREVLVLDAPRQRSGGVDLWSDAFAAAGEPGFDLAQAVAPYRLGAERIRRAAGAALDLAAFDGAPLSADHLRLAARQQSASGLERHARRIRPAVGWGDLVLPEAPLAQLHELVLRARHRERVLGEWRLSAGGGRGRGTLALFAGESGTGKTLSAEVVAAELGLDLYVVQLSSVVDKYVGETEKNLERIFTEADRTDAVLLFDEADAVFGKRSAVKDSHDRYANLESAYLLQRLESFDGIVLLTTNLRANIDDAFTRRLDLVVDFPFPDAEQRLALWRHSLAHVPCAEGLDPEPCAAEFELAGGSIRSAAVTAAYAAAGRGSPVTGADLLSGARREYRKAGRLVLEPGSW
ncbi:ATP-binding protein [Streptacidiphilus albus]|uniref:ATP-binding protein n=1 Tax=Streptacidiphilus albus TaxID=105425 RepID=UPI00054BAB02|nr:ATP-binding protein [Streptacidiphilus albus]